MVLKGPPKESVLLLPNFENAPRCRRWLYWVAKVETSAIALHIVDLAGIVIDEL